MTTERMRSVLWTNDGLQLLDQRKLPTELVVMRCNTVTDVTRAITDMVVRGAPAIGAAGAFGLALAAMNFYVTESSTGEAFLNALEQAKATIDAARPTAVNLTWGTRPGPSMVDSMGWILTVGCRGRAFQQRIES